MCIRDRWWVNANYSNQVNFRANHVDGLSWDIYGGTAKNYNCIEDLWDSLVSVANYRSVAQGVNCLLYTSGSGNRNMRSRYVHERKESDF